MEAILTLTLFVTALLVWKVMAMNEHHEHLREDIKNINGQLEGVAKLLAELQPKGPIEIPVRLNPELVEELLATEATVMDGLKITTPKRNNDKFKEMYRTQAYTTYDAEVKPRSTSDSDRRAKLTENEKQTLETLYGKPKNKLTEEETEEKKQRILKEFSARLEFKQKQRELLKAMMEADERDGLYDNEDTQTEGHTLSELTEKQKNDIRENVRERKKRSLNK